MWTRSCEKNVFDFCSSAKPTSNKTDLVQLDKLDYEQELFNHSRNVVHFQDKVVSPKIMAKIEAQRSLADFYTVNAISVDDLVNS